jgi:hypothetical protein
MIFFKIENIQTGIRSINTSVHGVYLAAWFWVRNFITQKTQTKESGFEFFLV